MDVSVSGSIDQTPHLKIFKVGLKPSLDPLLLPHHLSTSGGPTLCPLRIWGSER